MIILIVEDRRTPGATETRHHKALLIGCDASASKCELSLMGERRRGVLSVDRLFLLRFPSGSIRRDGSIETKSAQAPSRLPNAKRLGLRLVASPPQTSGAFPRTQRVGRNVCAAIFTGRKRQWTGTSPRPGGHLSRPFVCSSPCSLPSPLSTPNPPPTTNHKRRKTFQPHPRARRQGIQLRRVARFRWKDESAPMKQMTVSETARKFRAVIQEFEAAGRRHL